LLAATALLLPSAACPQFFSEPAVLELDPSARASAMGHTGTAVFWGAFPDFYRNPALLGHHRGVRYEWSSTQLVPQLADDLFVRANRLTLGEWGVGATFSGEPISGLGGTTLDYPDQELLDFGGQVIATFDPYEEVDTWGVGVNAIELAENLLHRGRGRGDVHPISRFGDISYGFAAKDVETYFGPDIVTGDEMRGRMTTHDHGLLVRLTPYDSIDHEGVWPALDYALAPIASGLRVDFSAGFSWINDADETIDFPDGSDPVSRVERRGYALRAALGLPTAVETELEARNASWLAGAFSPIVSVGLAWDQKQQTYGTAESEELGSNGVEITLFNVFTLRTGEYEAFSGGDEVTDLNTWGYGLGFHVQGLGGVYFDRAEVELASGLDNHEPTAFGFWVDPPGLWRALR
jgi:hypothetical protein